MFDVALLDPVLRQARPESTRLVLVHLEALFSDDALDVELVVVRKVDVGLGRDIGGRVAIGRGTRFGCAGDGLEIESDVVGRGDGDIEPVAEELEGGFRLGRLVDASGGGAGEAEQALGGLERCGLREALDIVLGRHRVDLCG